MQDLASFQDNLNNEMLKSILSFLLQPYLESYFIILHLIAMVS